jgi:ubiquinone/menaquinone biosynthesis C-methylase UbiE
MWNNFFSRQMIPSERDPRVLVDSQLPDADYVNTFGFEWTQIDGFVGKEVMSHGHIYGRFRLPADYFHGKVVVDVGCGNGRIGRLVAPSAERYLGLDLSEAVFSFPNYLRTANVQLCRASGTDLPLKDEIADVTICWGVLHHMDDPERALGELRRITKPGGEILVFIYSDAYAARENFNRFVKHIADDIKHELIENTSDYLDAWREVDKLYADLLSQNLFMSVKQSREWQIFQWYDGVSPAFHHSLTGLLIERCDLEIFMKAENNGIYRFRRADKRC